MEFKIFGEFKKYCDYQGCCNCNCSHFVAASFSLSSPPSNTHPLWLKQDASQQAHVVDMFSELFPLTQEIITAPCATRMSNSSSSVMLMDSLILPWYRTGANNMLSAGSCVGRDCSLCCDLLSEEDSKSPRKQAIGLLESRALWDAGCSQKTLSR